jgi:alpha-aminoadipate carrier protein LysW
MISCPECDAVLDIEPKGLEEGDTLSCEECGASLVVTAIDPELEIELDDDDEDDEEGFDDEFDEDDEDGEEDEEEEAEDEDADWH